MSKKTDISVESTATRDAGSVSVPPTGLKPPLLLSRLVDASRKRFGGAVLTGTEMDRRIVVVEPYGLAFQHLIDSTGLPLQSFITLAGKPKSYKSSALLELARTFQSQPYNGMAIVIHTEGKYSPSKVRSILGSRSDELLIVPASSVSEWQKAAGYYLNWVREQSIAIRKANKKGARNVNEQDKGAHVPPLIILIDSLTGAQTEAVGEQIVDNNESVGRAFPERAMQITTWLNTWASKLIGLPVLVVGSNHLKQDLATGPSGIPGHHTPGGAAVGFHTSLEIWVKCGLEKRRGGRVIKELQWKINFSSIGRDDRKIVIPYVEGYDDDGNQLDFFDWDDALVRLILELQTKTTDYPGLKDEYHIVAQSGEGGPYYSCKQLGVTPDDAIDSKISGSQLGRVLQTDPNHRARLQKLLRVQTRNLWSPESDLGELEEKKD